MSSLFGFSAPTYYSWKKEERPIILLLEKYFEKKDLIDFLNSHKIDKLELIKNYDIDELRHLLGNQQAIDLSSINTKLNQFERATLIYFLYIFKKERTITDYDTLLDFIADNLKKPDFIMAKIIKYISGFKPTLLENENVSLKLHINNFNEDCKDYLNNDELDYIFKNKDYYYDFILRNVEKKR